MRWRIAWTVLAVLGLVGGCKSSHPSDSSAARGGYSSEQEDFNVFRVRYAGNASVSKEKASEMVLLRAAELALEHGFEYLAVIASQNEIDRMGKPLTRRLIGCFRRDPRHVRSAYDVYDAAELFAEIASKHELKRNGKPMEPERGSFEASPDSIRFAGEPWYAGAPIAVEDVEYIVRDASGFDMDGTRVGRYADLENPMATIEDFVEAARPIAARYGANALVIEDDPIRIHGSAGFNDVDEVLIGFVADLYVVPTASLGIEWEPGDLMLDKHIIRRFRPGSRCAEAGLRLGDKVLAINSVDVLDTNALLRQSMQWSVDETAVLSVVRDGQEIHIEVPLVPNIIVGR